MAQSTALKNLKAQQRRRTANLLDPNWTPLGEKDRVNFPAFDASQSTMAYVAKYQFLNNLRKPVVFECANLYQPPAQYSPEPLLAAESLQADGRWA